MSDKEEKKVSDEGKVDEEQLETTSTTKSLSLIGSSIVSAIKVTTPLTPHPSPCKNPHKFWDWNVINLHQKRKSWLKVTDLSLMHKERGGQHYILKKRHAGQGFPPLGPI